MTTNEANGKWHWFPLIPQCVTFVPFETVIEHHRKAVIRESNIFIMLRIECKYKINMHDQN